MGSLRRKTGGFFEFFGIIRVIEVMKVIAPVSETYWMVETHMRTHAQELLRTHTRPTT